MDLAGRIQQYHNFPSHCGLGLGFMGIYPYLKINKLPAIQGISEYTTVLFACLNSLYFFQCSWESAIESLLDVSHLFH